MATDWDKLKYEFDLYRRTPRAKRHAIIAGATAVLFIAVFVVKALLPSLPVGTSEREARKRDAELLGDPALRGPRDFAAAFMNELRGDARFASVQAVPIAAGQEQGVSVMIQGVVASEADRGALEAIARKVQPPARIDWQVAVSTPAPGGG
jgi:hypothetical protein